MSAVLTAVVISCAHTRSQRALLPFCPTAGTLVISVSGTVLAAVYLSPFVSRIDYMHVTQMLSIFTEFWG